MKLLIDLVNVENLQTISSNENIDVVHDGAMLDFNTNLLYGEKKYPTTHTHIKKNAKMASVFSCFFTSL